MVWGTRDPINPWPLNRRGIARALPHARVATLPTGHEPFSENPALFLDAVRPFSRRLHPRPAPDLSRPPVRAGAGPDRRPSARAERLATGIQVYLDGCLAEPATKALLVQARTEAALGDEVAQRNRQAADVITEDLSAIGWTDPEPVASLLVATIAEAALMELVDRSPRPDLRDALLRLAARAV
ncbi:alpha/beta fold hydrolase [Nocardia sp. CC227C]|uniref:alpha/beta fold hydrolase n=1 Tax=Nocardia sp. CC227C TaxID=3044562 RepID=UPI00278BC921|nr:hypothetical protein [Nocardia sp. CC227C]